MARTPKRAQRGFTCALQRCRPERIACCSRAIAALLFLYGALPGSAAADPLGDTLRWPLTLEPRVMRGGFGEPRATHFHAGLDLSTRQRTGADVVAPADVTVERVRASGAGYGRSLYLRAGDGRLIVYGHLDAFAPELAAYVDSAQRATGEYEVDLWPPAGRFTFGAGARVAWSGESGAGPPHLHVEVRHGDFALNPLLAGLAVADTVPPRITRIVLEPLDERSWVERGAGPHVRALRDVPDTIVVEGRARLVVVATDRTTDAHDLPVRIVGARWNGTWAESRMDSVSWAGEMSQLEWLLDVGRIAGSDGIVLDAPAGWRPRFLATNRPDSAAVNLVTVAPGDPAQPLELWATDAAGKTASHQVWLRGPRGDERGPARQQSPPERQGTRRRGKRAVVAPARAAPPRWEFFALPERRLRVRVTGAPAALGDVRITRGAPRGLAGDSALATWDGKAWSAVLDLSNTPDPEGLTIKGTRAGGSAWWHRGSFALWPSGTSLAVRIEDWAETKVDPERVYEPGVLVARPASLTGVPAGATAVRATLELQPLSPPLKGSVPVTLALPRDLTREKMGVYHRDREGEAWDWTDAEWDSVAHVFRFITSRLGQFALLRDTAPPTARVLVPAKRPRAGGAYSTWRLAARVGDAASGVHGRRSAFTVDGVRVPTEWDAEEQVLRWRPLTPPAPGKHTYRLEVTDRAGNRTVRSGMFVIASP